MRNARRMASTATLACLLALLLVSTAHGAVSLGVSPGGAITAVSAGRVTFEGGGVSVRCALTLNGHITNTGVTKSAANRLFEGLIGAVTEGRFAECTESFGTPEARLLTEASTRFELVYASFTGTLPNITGVLLNALGVSVQIRNLFATCLYTGTLGFLVSFPAEGSGNTVRFLEASRFRLASGGEQCVSEGSLRGTARLTPAQRLTLRGEAIIRGRIRAVLNALTLELTSEGGAAVNIRSIRSIAREGGIEIRQEPRCGRWMWAGVRCIATVTVLARPASGEIVVEYESLFVGTEVRVSYTRL